MVRHLLPSGARFIFNCYCHHSSLVLRYGDGADNIIHSIEGLIQGYPLAIVPNSNGIILMIKCLKSTYPDVTHPWYDKYSGALCPFNNLEQYFKSLRHNIPAQGYYPNCTKIILSVHLKNLEAEELFVRHHGFKVCTYASYLGGYIGDDVSKVNCIKNWMDKWERDICALRKMADKYPQESHAMATCTVQSGWIFLQYVTKDTGKAFKGLENVPQEIFLPHIFFGKSKTLPPIVGYLSKLPAKKYGLGLQNPVMSAK